MRNTLLIWAVLSLLFLWWCWNSYPLEIESWNISWNPSLKANMQVIDFDEENGDVMFQEISDDEDDNLDTLIVAYDSEDYQSNNIWLASYVQMSINQIKDLWVYELSDEKAEKKTIWEHQAILKTYQIKDDERELYVAQEFIELNNKNVVMLSFTSDESSHVKTFIKELSTLQIN